MTHPPALAVGGCGACRRYAQMMHPMHLLPIVGTTVFARLRDMASGHSESELDRSRTPIRFVLCGRVPLGTRGRRGSAANRVAPTTDSLREKAERRYSRLHEAGS